MAKDAVYLELTARADAKPDFAGVVECIANSQPVDLSQWEVKTINLAHSARPDTIDFIKQFGLTRYLKQELLTEALISKASSAAFADSLLTDFLQGIKLTSELIVVDPYFFPPNCADISVYTQRVSSLLLPFLGNLRKITVITGRTTTNQSVVAAFQARIAAQNSSISLGLATSNNYHDRFWLNPISRLGVLSGTSLNGLGNKYAVLDYLEPLDVIDILKALTTDGLI